MTKGKKGKRSIIGATAGKPKKKVGLKAKSTRKGAVARAKRRAKKAELSA
jgi:hypothetical protein